MELAVEGRRAFAATGGRPPDTALPAVVFVHGAGMDHTVWVFQTRYFAHHGHAVLAVDLPGHGRSEGPVLDSIGALADWLGALLMAAGLDRATLVGHSMGALVALETAARAPDRVARLALLGAATPMPVHPDLLAAARAGDHLAHELVTDWGYGSDAHLGGHRAPGLWLMGGGLRLLERGTPGVLGADLGACDGYTDGLASAARVRCPALVLSGGADRMTSPKAAAPLVGALADCRAVVLPGAGHMMMLEQPGRTLDALEDFI